MNRLAQLREIAIQTDHHGERVNALRSAAREQGSTFAFEDMICRMEQRARIFERLAKEYPQVDGLLELAEREREAISLSFLACGRQ